MKLLTAPFFLLLALSSVVVVQSMPNPTSFSDIPYDALFKCFEYFDSPSDILALRSFNKSLQLLFSIMAEHCIGSIKKDLITSDSMVNNKIFIKCFKSSDHRTISPIDFLSILLSHRSSSSDLFHFHFQKHPDLHNYNSLVPLIAKNARIKINLNPNLLKSFSTDRTVLKHMICIFYENENYSGATDIIFKLFNTMPTKTKQKINWTQFQEAFHIDSWRGVNNETIQSILNKKSGGTDDLEPVEQIEFSQNQIFVLLICFIATKDNDLYLKALKHASFKLTHYNAIFAYLLHSFDFTQQIQLFLQQEYNRFYTPNPNHNFQGDHSTDDLLLHISNIAENTYFYKYLLLSDPTQIPFIFLFLKRKVTTKPSLYKKICQFLLEAMKNIQNPNTLYYRFDIRDEDLIRHGLTPLNPQFYSGNASFYSMVLDVVPCLFCASSLYGTCEACEYLKSNLISSNPEVNPCDSHDVKLILASSYFTSKSCSNRISSIEEIDQ